MSKKSTVELLPHANGGVSGFIDVYVVMTISVCLFVFVFVFVCLFTCVSCDIISWVRLLSLHDNLVL